MPLNPTAQDKSGIVLANFDGTADAENYPSGNKPQGGGGGGALEITGVTGSFSAGQQLTIDGSFTAKRNGQLAFINFEGDTLGSQSSQLDYEGIAGRAQYQVSDDTPLFGGKFARAVATQRQLDATKVEWTTETREIFFEVWSRAVRTDFDSGGDEQIKYWRAGGGTGFGTIQQPNESPIMGFTHSGSGFTCYYSPNTPAEGGGSNSYFSSTPTDNAWFRISSYVDLGTASTADGKRYAKTSLSDVFTQSTVPRYHSPNETVPDADWDGELQQLDDGALITPAGFKRLYLPYFQREDQTTQMDCDRIYVNDSPERVVVGDASTWSACSDEKIFVLEQGSRTASQIIANVDSTGPLAGMDAWLYVFNSDGEYNENGVAL